MNTHIILRIPYTVLRLIWIVVIARGRHSSLFRPNAFENAGQQNHKSPGRNSNGVRLIILNLLLLYNKSVFYIFNDQLTNYNTFATEGSECL